MENKKTLTVTPSQIIQYLYCPRFIYFEYVLAIPQYQERLYKVQKGREVHADKLKINKVYLRKKIGAVGKEGAQYLTNSYLRGEVDEVLYFQDGTAAPLDYKFAKYKDQLYKTYQTQMFCYALLIEENLGKSVEKAFIVYTRSKNKLLEIEVTEKDKQATKKMALEVVKIIEDNHFPKATRAKKKCLNCTYRNICVQ